MKTEEEEEEEGREGEGEGKDSTIKEACWSKELFPITRCSFIGLAF